ncbi:thyrotropin-releasing hormone receptor-like [Exaiptasia diaphana]|uniref:G-protein coupled receptors family 1 profile domain-containing protein n=1 Tax=Exaiptasia diaphana TaxID=2652724 RepID=A0A913XJG5_EXADI|nr:thyrotropin-releasing hormone receptor-like [Exaiptasia diaphana]
MNVTVHIAVRTAFSLVTVTGIVGNILVCLVVLLNKPMRTPMNYLLVNLAISDMMLLVFFTPTFIFRDAYTHPAGQTGDILCVFLTGESFAWVGGYASSYFLVAIAIERHYAVTKPYVHGYSITRNKLKILVVSCWIFSIAWNSIGFAVKRYDPSLGFCASEWPAEYSFKVYALLSLIVLGIIPITTMSVLYSRVVYALWVNREVTQVNNLESERKRRMKATKMVLTVSVIYTLSWVPELTIFVVAAYAPSLMDSTVIYPASVAMVTLNSAVNPIIYTLHGERFRYFLKKLVCCCTKGKDELRPSNVLSMNSVTQFQENEGFDTRL